MDSQNNPEIMSETSNEKHETSSAEVNPALGNLIPGRKMLIFLQRQV